MLDGQKRLQRALLTASRHAWQERRTKKVKREKRNPRLSLSYAVSLFRAMKKRGAKGTSRAGGGKRARPAAAAPLVEDPPDPRASLEAEGYVFWRGAVPARLCEPLAAAVEAEIDEQLNAGSPCQEIPSEHLSDTNIPSGFFPSPSPASSNVSACTEPTA